MKSPNFVLKGLRSETGICRNLVHETFNSIQLCVLMNQYTSAALNLVSDGKPRISLDIE